MPRIIGKESGAQAVGGEASMRPGRNAPDNLIEAKLSAWAAARFNEAGAKCPG